MDCFFKHTHTRKGRHWYIQKRALFPPREWKKWAHTSGIRGGWVKLGKKWGREASSLQEHYSCSFTFKRSKKTLSHSWTVRACWAFAGGTTDIPEMQISALCVCVRANWTANQIKLWNAISSNTLATCYLCHIFATTTGIYSSKQLNPVACHVRHETFIPLSVLRADGGDIQLTGTRSNVGSNECCVFDSWRSHPGRGDWAGRAGRGASAREPSIYSHEQRQLRLPATQTVSEFHK